MPYTSTGLKKINSLLGMNNKLIQCKQCRERFVENELDRLDGEWICRNCEDQMSMGVRL